MPRRVIDLSDIDGIPAEALAELEALPDAIESQKKVTWDPWQDEVLLRTWRIKRQADVAKIIGVSQGTARKRYRELTDGGQ